MTPEQFASPFWRLANLYRIVDDDGRELPFRPNPEQEYLYRNLRPRNLVLKGRQLGFTTAIDLLMLDQCAFNSNYTGAIIAHSLPDAARIFRTKVLKPYLALPPILRERIPLERQSTSELVFTNGSSISVSTSVRSGTVNFLHVSEMGKIARKYPERADEIVSGSFEAVPRDGLIVVESTAEGASGWYYDACMKAHRRQQQGVPESLMDFHLHFFPWTSKPDYSLAEHVPLTDEQVRYFADLERSGIKLTRGQKSWYVKKEDTLGDKMKREYPCTVEEAFAAAIEGAVYAREMALLRRIGRIGPVPHKPGIPVNTFWDLGVNDLNTIWLHQRVGAMNRFLRFFQGHSEGMRYYWNLLEEWRTTNEARWGSHYLPHDGDNRIQGFEIETRKDILEELGARDVRIVPRVADVRDGIELARRVLPECEFDAEGCAEGIACLDSYSYEWNSDQGAWSGRPRHDRYSNGADAFRQFAQGYRPQAVDSGARRSAAPAGVYAFGY
jgi:hypothetical protein